MESHMDFTMKRHLDLACKKLEQQEKKLEQQEKKLEEQEEKLEEQEKNLEEQEKNLEMIKREHSNRMEAAEKNIEMLLNRFSLDKENESFTWKIPDLFSRLTNDRSIYSEPFFLRGYRMVLFLKLGAFNFGSSALQRIISVGFVMKRGKFDNELEWPFTGKLDIDWFVGPLSRGSFILQPNKAIARPVSPNEEEEDDSKEITTFRKLEETRFCEHYVTAKFVY